MRWFWRLFLVCLLGLVVGVWYRKFVMLPEGGVWGRVCGLHASSLYRQTGDHPAGDDREEEERGGENFDFIVSLQLEGEDVTVDFLTQDRALFEGFVVGEGGRHCA